MSPGNLPILENLPNPQRINPKVTRNIPIEIRILPKDDQSPIT